MKRSSWASGRGSPLLLDGVLGREHENGSGSRMVAPCAVTECPARFEERGLVFWGVRLISFGE